MHTNKHIASTIGTQSLIPWVNAESMAPNIILRSALFSAIDISKPSAYVKNQVIYSQGGVDIEFTGEQLNQKDLDTWLGIMKMVSTTRSLTVVIESERSFLKMLGISSSGSSSDQLRASIKKLTSGLVVIKNKDKKLMYGGHLISEYWFDNQNLRWACRTNEEMIKLFSPGNWTKIDWSIRIALRRNPLASWLHGYYSSHKKSAIPINVETLRKLCGSKCADTKTFKQKLKMASTFLAATCKDNDRQFEWRIDDANNFFTTHTLSSNKAIDAVNDTPVGQTIDIDDTGLSS